MPVWGNVKTVGPYKAESAQLDIPADLWEDRFETWDAQGDAEPSELRSDWSAPAVATFPGDS